MKTNMMIWLTMRKDPCLRIMRKKSKIHLMPVANTMPKFNNCIWLKVTVMQKEQEVLVPNINNTKNTTEKIKSNMYPCAIQKHSPLSVDNQINTKVTSKNRSLPISPKNKIRLRYSRNKKKPRRPQLMARRINTMMKNAIKNAGRKISKSGLKGRKKSNRIGTRLRISNIAIIMMMIVNKNNKKEMEAKEEGIEEEEDEVDTPTTTTTTATNQKEPTQTRRNIPPNNEHIEDVDMYDS